ncbi:MAG: hypothetical protein OXT65_11670 [Alphaproteobacteria bacterium]|nr:hypothetical protein [Alphaproteobacteria bacterium]
MANTLKITNPFMGASKKLADMRKAMYKAATTNPFKATDNYLNIQMGEARKALYAVLALSMIGTLGKEYASSIRRDNALAASSIHYQLQEEFKGACKGAKLDGLTLPLPKGCTIAAPPAP